MDPEPNPTPISTKRVSQSLDFAFLVCSRNSNYSVLHTWPHSPAATHDLPEIALLLQTEQALILTPSFFLNQKLIKTPL